MVKNEMYPELFLSENEKFERIIKTINKRFTTYGYKRIKTSAFEQYDLYSKVKSSINQNEMMKVIDRTGQVLVIAAGCNDSDHEGTGTKFPESSK